MAVKAYILIETAVGKTKDVVNALRGLEGIKAADAVTGPYDVVAVVEMADLTGVGDLVTKKVHTAAGVARTMTCLVIQIS